MKVEQRQDRLGGSPAAASPRDEADGEDEAAGPEISDRKAHKKMLKEQQKKKRIQNKQLKNAFTIAS